jgi:hypothetical protein
MWEAEIRRIMVTGQPWQTKKFMRPHLKEKHWVWWHAPVNPATAKSSK